MVKRSNKRVSRDQWLLKALEIFARTGPDGLRVEKLARSLNVAKSGFYFHFKDRDDLLKQLVDYWVHEYTEVVTRNPLLLMATPRERLRMIATLVFEQNLTEFESAMQVWSNEDPEIARKVGKVIKTRLAFISRALAELGFEGEELAARARVFLGYITSERQIFGPGKKNSERAREWLLETITSKS